MVGWRGFLIFRFFEVLPSKDKSSIYQSNLIILVIKGAQADLSLRWAHTHFAVLSCRGSYCFHYLERVTTQKEVFGETQETHNLATEN